jgi:hypothetical protein
MAKNWERDSESNSFLFRKGHMRVNKRGSMLMRSLCFLIVLLFLFGYYIIYGPDLKTMENNLEDWYQRTMSSINQLTTTNAPSFSEEKKMMMGRWEIREDSCVVAKQFFLAVGMRVPKSASVNRYFNQRAFLYANCS